MSKHSAGILAYRFNSKKKPEVLLVHPGGPFYSNKDEGVWSVPKGEYEEGEDLLNVAKKEFEEETGNILVEDHFIELDPIKIKSGKIINVWAVEANFDPPFISSNTFEVEWPLHSGNKQQFQEIDEAEYFSIERAKQKILIGQLPLIDQLMEVLDI